MRIRDILKRNTRVVVMAVAVVIFLAVLQNIRSEEILRIDAMAYKLFVVKLRRPWLTPLMEGFSDLSSPVVIAGMYLMVIAFAPGRRPGACAFLNLVGVVAANQVLKYIVQRPRPSGFNLVSEVGYSFPSGHSMVSMAFYGLCAWMVWTYERDKIVRWLCCLSFALIILLVGISRVYLGVHYFSDVVAGLCVSLSWLCIYTILVCPLFMPEEKQRHEQEVASPAYVEPARLYVADDTTAMRARHMRWSKSKVDTDSDDANR